MFDPNWQRWIYASLATYFKTVCDDNDIPIFIEGSPRTTDDLEDWVEIRILGPDWNSGTAIEWVADNIEVSALVMSKLNQTNNYRIHDNIGIIVDAFVAPIPVFKLGTGVGDDQSQITCLQSKTKGRDQIKVAPFGQVDPNTQLLRASVDGFFWGNFFN